MSKRSLTIIGITGKARAGKDTIASAMADQGVHGAEVYVMSLATPMKDMLEELLYTAYDLEGTLWDHLYGARKEDPMPDFNGRSPRHLLQTLGTDWGRKMIDEDLWINCLMRTAQYWHDSNSRNTVIVIPDVRFDNEAAQCSAVVQVLRSHETDVRDHVSESGVSPHLIHHTIHNDGDIADVYDEAGRVLKEIVSGQLSV